MASLKKPLIKISGVLLASLATTQVIAAALPSGLGAFLPSTSLPERVSKSLSTPPATLPKKKGPQEITPPEQAAAVNKEAEKIKFTLNSLTIKGNHVYSTQDLLPLYKDRLHKTISVAELFNIVQSITNYYRNNGYILSRAVLPPQKVKNGKVEVLVIEGYVDKVSVQGTPRRSLPLIYGFGEKIAEQRPLQIKRMERYMLLADEVPGTDVKAVLSPSKTKTGAADLTMVTNNRILTGYLSYDDYGTRYIGPQQMTANAALNSLITPGDALNVTITKTPRTTELTFIDTNYNAALDANGTRLLAGITHTGTAPQFVLQPLDIQGLTSNYYAGVQYPVIRSRTESLNIRGGFNYMDSGTDTFGLTLYNDHLRSLSFGTTYNFADRYYGANLISADIRQGLPIWGYSSDTNIATAQTSRPGGHANYTKLTGTLSRIQSIYGPLSFYIVGNGQYAFEALLASEQFSFGGPQIGRGYDPAEILGDKGVDGSAELRYDWNVGGKLMLQSVQFYAFYDAGIVWDYYFVGGVPKRQDGTSTGFGARFYLTKYISGNLMWTQPLTRKVAAIDLLGNGSAPRMFFSFVAALS